MVLSSPNLAKYRCHLRPLPPLLQCPLGDLDDWQNGGMA